MARYLSTTAMGGKLYPQDLSDRGPWRPERLVYYTEEVARFLASIYRGSVVTDAGDLRRIVAASILPAVKVFVREDLQDEARRLWEEQQEEQRRTPRQG